MTIGRTKDNEVFCLHKSLSRKHAQVDCDGTTVRITDLASKNGVFYGGNRVQEVTLADGDSFRCGDITFLVESATSHVPRTLNSGSAQTLPSPFAVDAIASKRGRNLTPAAGAPAVDERYKDKLFVLIRASELLTASLPIDRLLEELVVLAAQVVDVDRLALLTRTSASAKPVARVVKTFLGGARAPYSQRVVDWVFAHGSQTSFADLGRDKTLPGNVDDDAGIRSAVCVPIDPGTGVIGVLYADSLTTPEIVRPDDLALVRALANLAAAALATNARR
ncbi:Adenylate cyclase [Labilithrix luteola]|uniref:Adenylate cyclase n=1 Tax=Labilithrix luteola TaxID=1391654 RepID=A0A0K1PX82_9BACT|nr:Adenylate cyclase [Labilithrix luteola]